jgi:hypothetical protein
MVVTFDMIVMVVTVVMVVAVVMLGKIDLIVDVSYVSKKPCNGCNGYTISYHFCCNNKRHHL